MIENPTDAQLDALGISVLPAWLRWEPADVWPGGQLDVRDVLASDPDGAPVRLPGPWVCSDRADGALAKHQIDERFGPESTAPGRAPAGPRPA